MSVGERLQAAQAYFDDAERVQRGSFTGARGLEIPFALCTEPPAGSSVALTETPTVMLTGYAEAIAKYAEMAHDLACRGHPVLLMEWRSQGHAGRPLKNPQIVHVLSFEEYLDDLEHFMRDVAPRPAGGRFDIVAHSMGGLHASRFAARCPDLVRKVVLSAPLYQFRLPMPHWLAVIIGFVICLVGFGERYLFGHEDSYPDKPLKLKLTHCETREEHWIDMRRKDPIVLIGGPSFAWFLAGLMALYKLWYIEARRIEAPVLLLQAEDDIFVANSAHDAVLAKMPDARKIFYPDSFHELFIEQDLVRNRVLDDIDNFLKEPM